MKKIIWNGLKGYMRTAWKQCFSEGLDVEDLKLDCEKADNNPDFSEHDAEILYEKMLNRPTRQNFSFFEPNEYDDILKEATVKAHAYKANLTHDKIKGAWAGRICGCMLGKPLEGHPLEYRNKVFKAAGNLPITHYLLKSETPPEAFSNSDLYDNCFFVDKYDVMPGDDDVNYTVLSLLLFEKYGENFQPDDVLDLWLSQLPFLAVCTAERVAYRNAIEGLSAPQTAMRKNPYREYIGAQIRADFYGYVYQGKPEKAVWAAYRDGCISHVKNGIYGGMFVAAAVSLSSCFNNTLDIVKTALDFIPKRCRLRKRAEEILSLYNSGARFEELLKNIRDKVVEETDEFEWGHTIHNALIVIAALLCGEGDFDKSITLAVSAGLDTDCNGATVGSIVGLMNGFSEISEKWYAPINQKTRTNLFDVPEISFDQLTERTLKIINLLK